jgi:hypothetical protein
MSFNPIDEGLTPVKILKLAVVIEDLVVVSVIKFLIHLLLHPVDEGLAPVKILEVLVIEDHVVIGGVSSWLFGNSGILIIGNNTIWNGGIVKLMPWQQEETSDG